MRTIGIKGIAVAVIAIAAVLFALPAHADTVQIWVSVNGGAAILEATGNGSASTGTIIVGDFSINASGTGTPPLNEPNLSTSNIDVEQISGTAMEMVNVWVTESGLTFPVGTGSFLSSFTSNQQTAVAVTAQTFINAASVTPSGVPTATTNFFAGGGPTQSASSINTVALSSPFIESALYHITTNPGQELDATIAISNVPEPATLALLGTGLLGLGLIRRRATKA